MPKLPKRQAEGIGREDPDAQGRLLATGYAGLTGCIIIISQCSNINVVQDLGQQV